MSQVKSLKKSDAWTNAGRKEIRHLDDGQFVRVNNSQKASMKI